jgi:hypothetical protein
MEVSDKNPNNVGGVGSQSFLASSSLIKNGVNDTAYINILSLNDGSLKTETIVLTDDAPPNKISEAKFSVPNDQLIEDALNQLIIDLNLSSGDLTIESTQYFEVPNTIKKEFIITGTVIDFYKNLPLPNVSIILPLPGTKFTTKTNSQGKFKIKAVYPVDKNTERATLRPPILVTAKGYIPKKLTPYALDQTVKSDLRTTQLKSTQGLTAEAKAEIGRLKKKTVKFIQRLKPKKGALKLVIKKFITQLKERLIPFLLALLAPFLIGKISDIIAGKISQASAQGPCPSPEEVIRIKNRRNKIVRQLNQLYKLVNTALVIVGILGGLAAVIKIAAGIIRAIPLPTAVPPGVGFPTSLILNFQRLIDKLLKVAEKTFTLSLGISSALLVLSSLLLQALKLLKLLDQQLLRCSENIEDLEDLDFTIEDDEEEDTQINNLVNGFTLAVVVDNKSKVGSLQRRYATATNPQGVVILKGEPSFSASEQILIDELAFYIRSNDLKAN